RTVAVRRFETPPGKQAQVDWGHLGTLEMEGQEQKLWGFTFTLGYSRRMMAEAALDQKHPRRELSAEGSSSGWPGATARTGRGGGPNFLRFRGGEFSTGIDKCHLSSKRVAAKPLLTVVADTYFCGG